MPSDASFAPALLGERRTDTGRAEKLSLALAARAQARRERWPARSRGGTLANPIWMPAGWSGPLGPNGMSSGSVRFRRSVPSNSRQVWIRRLSCGRGQASIASTPLREPPPLARLHGWRERILRVPHAPTKPILDSPGLRRGPRWLRGPGRDDRKSVARQEC